VRWRSIAGSVGSRVASLHRATEARLGVFGAATLGLTLDAFDLRRAPQAAQSLCSEGKTANRSRKA